MIFEFFTARAIIGLALMACCFCPGCGKGIRTGKTVIPNVVNVSSSNENGGYKTGDSLTIVVSFSKNVTVVGNPSLTLNTGTGEEAALYTSGSGTGTLLFTYTVQSGDLTTHLDYASSSAIILNDGLNDVLNNGRILDSAGNNANIVLPSPGATASLGMNTALSIDGMSPSAPGNFTDGSSQVVPTDSPTFTWSASSDLGTGISFYEIAIGTTAGGSDVYPWTSVGNVTSVSITGLALTAGNAYYASVRAVDEVGNRSASSRGDGWNQLSYLHVIAGNSSSGTGLPASQGIFVNNTSDSLSPDGGSLVIASDGTVYFRDYRRGILKISSSDQLQQVLIPVTGVSTGDGGSVASATLADPIKIALDYSDRLLIYDNDRIRRVDTTVSPMTISTIIGGGVSVADNVGPLQVQFSAMSASVYNRGMVPLVALPNGDIYFQSDNFYPSASERVRIYHASTTGLVTSVVPSGVGYDQNGATDISTCSQLEPAIAFDRSSSTVTQIQFTISGSCTPGAVIVDPTTGSSTGLTQPDKNHGPCRIQSTSQCLPYFTKRTTSRNGVLYGISRYNGALYKYNSGTGAWDVVLGTGYKGHCADGTAATSCKTDILDAFINDADVVYFVDRGQVRYIDGSNNVQTLMGASLSSGDGGAATSGRLNVINSIAQRNSGEIVVLDQQELKFREFTIDGTINTIAGTGDDGDTPVGTAVGNPINQQSRQRNWDSFWNDPVTGDIFYHSHVTSNWLTGPTWVEYISRLTRSTGDWTRVVGGGATAPNAADGSAGALVSLTSYPVRVLGFDGINILAQLMGTDSAHPFVDSYLKLYDSSNSWTQTHLAGTTEVASAFSLFSNDGTAGSSCHVPTSYSYPVRASYDSVGARWLLADQSASIRSLVAGGSIGTLVTLGASPVSFTYVRKDGGEYIFYCNASGNILRNNLTTEVTLPQWIVGSKCTGTSLLYDSSRNSLIFPYLINGSQVIGEYTDPFQ